jgi:hypothetical protein
MNKNLAVSLPRIQRNSTERIIKLENSVFVFASIYPSSVPQMQKRFFEKITYKTHAILKMLQIAVAKT